MITEKQSIKGSVSAKQSVSGKVVSIPSLDDTLSKQGFAADSKAVGDALSNKANEIHKHSKSEITDFPTEMPASDVYAWAKESKKPTYTASEVGARPSNWMPSASDVGAAPSGYGLGGVSQRVDSADDATQSGFYQAPVFPETGGGGQMFGYVSKSEDDWLTQIWHYVGLTIKRDKQGGVWQPLEWFNPPMVPGVEYRTTERWNDQPVYVKAIYFGNLPNSTRRNVPHGIDGKSENIRHSIRTEQSGRMFDGGAGITEVIANSTDIYITTNTDLSEYTIVFTLWYTKS